MDTTHTKSEKSNKIQKIFQTMEYGEVLENIDEAKAWLNSKNNKFFTYVENPEEVPNGNLTKIKNACTGETLCNIYEAEAETIDKVLEKSANDSKWIEINDIEKMHLLTKLGDEIRKNEYLFCQIEVAARGILSKDTKHKYFQLLVDYFHYYSAFAIGRHVLSRHMENNVLWKPTGLLVIIISDDNSLTSFGCTLGPALAAGYNIILQTGPKISVVASLIIDLATKIGIPSGTIRLIPGNVDLQTFLPSEKVSIISIFDNLYKKKFSLDVTSYKKINLFITCYRIPMIVFDDADLDSACECVIDAVWGYQGMLSWCVDNIVVQENIFDTFVQKLKHRMLTLKIGFGNDIQADISYPSKPNAVEELKKLVKSAEEQGIEVFQSNTGTKDNFKPTLFIGANVYDNVINKGESIDIPFASLTAFRTINEAVSLANNSQQGFAASVWAENGSLINEVAKKLKVCNVWVNSHGIMSVHCPMTPFKYGGNNYFNGLQGFYEYIDSPIKRSDSKDSEKMNLNEVVAKMKKMKDTWGKSSKLSRMQKLNALATNMYKNKKKLSNEEISESTIEEYSKYINNALTFDSRFSSNSFFLNTGINVNSYMEPRGLILITTGKTCTIDDLKFVIFSLLEGNVTIVLNKDKKMSSFYSFVVENLPENVITILPYSDQFLNEVIVNKDIDTCVVSDLSSNFPTLSLRDFIKFNAPRHYDTGISFYNCNKIKNVWTTVGQSFV